MKTKTEWTALTRPEQATMRRGRMNELVHRRACGTEGAPSEFALNIDRCAGKMGEFAAFAADLHATLRDDGASRALPEGQRNGVVAGLLEAARSQGKFAELADSASIHDSIAQDATTEMLNAVAKASGLDSIPDDNNGADQSPEEIQQQIDGLDGLPVDTDEAAQAKQDAQAKLEEALKKAKARRRSIVNKIEKAKQDGSLANAVAQAAAKAEKKARTVKSLRGAGIGSEGGVGGEDDPIDADLISKVENLSDVESVLALVGKMDEAADGEEATGEGKISPTGLTQGDDLSHLASSEWIKEQMDEDLLLMDVMEKRATQTEFESPEPLKDGDKVFMIDMSGSMSGEKIVWARAIGMAGVLRANKKGQRWGLAMYNTSNHVATSASPTALKDAFAKAYTYPHGGTSTDYCLRELLKSNALGTLKDPDVLLLTDGGWEPLEDETKELMKKLNVRLFVVMLDSVEGDTEGATKTWHVPSAAYTALTQDTAGEILAAMSKK